MTALPRRTEVDRPPAELAGELRQVVGRLAFHLRSPATGRGLTPTRLSALVALAKAGPQRSGDLAVSLGITAASMSRLTEVLHSEGWVDRGEDPDDHRACLLGLTDAGRAVLTDLRREGTSRLTAQIAALAPRQQRDLARAVPVLVELADGHLLAQPPDEGGEQRS